jgi:hypothetical protein
MSKKTLLEEIDDRLNELNELYNEADDGGHNHILDEIDMETETLQYVKKMINKHIKK